MLNLLQAWKTLQDRIESMEQWLTDDTRGRADLRALRTMPGIGVVLGLTVVLESGNVNRFDDVGQYASYCRMVPALRFSNGKKKGTGNRKCEGSDHHSAAQGVFKDLRGLFNHLRNQIYAR